MEELVLFLTMFAIGERYEMGDYENGKDWWMYV